MAHGARPVARGRGCQGVQEIPHPQGTGPEESRRDEEERGRVQALQAEAETVGEEGGQVAGGQKSGWNQAESGARRRRQRQRHSPGGAQIQQRRQWVQDSQEGIEKTGGRTDGERVGVVTGGQSRE